MGRFSVYAVSVYLSMYMFNPPPPRPYLRTTNRAKLSSIAYHALRLIIEIDCRQVCDPRVRDLQVPIVRVAVGGQTACSSGVQC